MSIYKQLIDDLKLKFGKDVNEYLFRISMTSDLERVKKFGSTRVGLSDMLWNKLDEYPKEIFPKYPVYHHDMIIASYWDDLEKDVLVENGTLKHKLKIYEKPFFTVYKKSLLKEIGKEESLGENNQGTHFYFLDKPINALDSLWQINENNQQYNVERIKWK
jgi:hypothetical protein